MRYLAVDLGAESGRVMLGTLEDGRISLEELSRFSNTPIRKGGAKGFSKAITKLEEMGFGERLQVGTVFAFKATKADTCGHEMYQP